MTPEKLAYARELLAAPDAAMASIARMLGVSRSTLYKALPDLKPAATVLPAARASASTAERVEAEH